MIEGAEKSDVSMHERMARVETKLEMIAERGSRNFEALSNIVARGRGMLAAIATIFGAISGAVMSWWLHK